MTTLSGAY